MGTSLLIVTTVSTTLRQFLRPFAARARELGWKVDAAANGATTDPVLVDYFDHRYEIPLSRSLLQVGALLGGYRAIARLLRETQPDIVHVHTPIASFLARLAVRRIPSDNRPAIVYTAHGFHSFEGGHRLVNALFVLAERLAGRWTDRLVVINDEDEAAARRHRLVAPGRLIRMPGIGIDTTWFSRRNVSSAAAAETRDHAGIRLDVPLVVVVGELSRNKRQADAIAAIAAMRNRDTRLLLLGEGPTRETLESIARRLGVTNRVVFGGSVSDVRPYLASAAALMLTSKREGLARSIMEGLAMEVPVVASNARGNQELVGESGFVVQIGDVAGLAEALDWIVEHPDERQSMGTRGRARMIAGYELRVILELHDRMYTEVLAERGWRQSIASGA